jgi:hypothetical protein
VRIELVREDRLPLPGGAVVSIAKPINDVLGFRNDDRYADWLGKDWQELAPSRREAATYARLRDELATIAAAASKEGGTLDMAQLAPFLSRVKYYAGAIEVPSLAVLAAWALEREVQRRVDWLSDCPICHRPWYTRPRTLASALAEPNRYCARPAPGLTVTCAQLEATDRFARERSEWSKEYRKVMARKLRGTVSRSDFEAWKAVSNPGKRSEDWTPFDEWKEKQDG